MKHEDKHGEWIRVGDHVNVDEPRTDIDIHRNAFTGVVIKSGPIYLVVQDLDGDCFGIDSCLIEVIITEDGSDDDTNEPSECPECHSHDTGIYMIDDNIGCGMHEEFVCNECDRNK